MLEPNLPIVDSHHHLWVKPDSRYLLEDYAQDLSTGHRVIASVYCESRTALRVSGPEHLRPVGESRFAAAVGALADTGLYGPTRIAAGIVAFVNLDDPKAADAVTAHIEASAGRLRGVRHSSYWDEDKAIVSHGSMLPPRHLLKREQFREGVAMLGERGLSFDAILFHPQLPELVDLAAAVPGTTIVLNHMGTPLGLGRFAGRRAQVLVEWRDSMAALSERPNVVVKLGGAGRPQWGFGFHERELRPDSSELAEAWQPYVSTCIELFRPDRCMFESNFPADRIAYDYRTFWNAAKTLTSSLDGPARAALFSETATRVYGLDNLGR